MKYEESKLILRQLKDKESFSASVAGIDQKKKPKKCWVAIRMESSSVVMFNVSTCCGITLACVLPLWESQSSFLPSLVFLPGSSTGQDSWLTEDWRGPDSGPSKCPLTGTDGGDIHKKPQNNHKIQTAFQGLLFLPKPHLFCKNIPNPWGLVVRESITNWDVLFTKHQSGRHGQGKRQGETSNPKVSTSSHPISHKHLDSYTRPPRHTSVLFVVWCWRRVLSEKSGEHGPPGASWVDKPGWWSSNPSIPVSTGLLFVICLCVPSFNLSSIF